MADFGAVIYTISNYVARAADTPAIIPAGFGASSSTIYYKMRALRDPFDTGFVNWVVTLEPDPDGTQAPETIVPGSAVITATWIA